MKLPDKIKGPNKIRDAAIMQAFLKENLTYKDIGLKFELTASRIQQIVFENRGLISWDKNYEKALRINALKRLHKEHPGVMGTKTTIDILEQVRKEIDGDDRGQAGAGSEVKVVVVYPPTYSGQKSNEVLIATPSNRVESLSS